LADGYAHELGHNVLMHHASTPGSEYGDISDFMGYGGVGLRGVNAPHREQMGWMPAPQIVSPSGNVTLNIAPLEVSPSSAIYPQTIKLAKPDTGEYYYFSY